MDRDRAMKEMCKKIDSSKEQKKKALKGLLIPLSSFIAVMLVIFLDEVLDLPYVIFNAPDTPINWVELLMEESLCVMVSIFFIIIFYKSNLRQYQSEAKLCKEHARVLFLNDLMDHDISNMIQIIFNYLVFLSKKSKLSNEFKKIIEIPLNQIKRVTKLISNVRKLSSVSLKGEKTEKIDIYKTLIYVIDSIKSSFPDKEIDIKHNLSSGEVIIEGNELMEDVIGNLLHNAVKFNQQKEVEVEINHSLSKDKGCWKIEFKDNGPGIPDSMKEKIFDRLQRGDESVGGTGLGLTLVKQIVEGYGGEIWVEDRIKGDSTKGSDFIVFLPKSN
jgi:signal transduction histidine kinase